MGRQIGHFYTGKKSTFANLAGKKAGKKIKYDFWRDVCYNFALKGTDKAVSCFVRFCTFYRRQYET